MMLCEVESLTSGTVLVETYHMNGITIQWFKSYSGDQRDMETPLPPFFEARINLSAPSLMDL